MSPKRSTDNRLILTLAMLLTIDGACAIVGISPLMACMVFGATYINIKKDQVLYTQMDAFAPPDHVHLLCPVGHEYGLRRVRGRRTHRRHLLLRSYRWQIRGALGSVAALIAKSRKSAIT
jgi:hypothetical protein